MGRAQPRRRRDGRRPRAGVRVASSAAGNGAVWARTLAELGDDLADVTDTNELANVGRRAARLLGAQDVSLMWVVDDCLELLSDNVDSPGDRWSLSEFPATERLLAEHTPGQVSSATATATRSRSPSSSASATAPS